MQLRLTMFAGAALAAAACATDGGSARDAATGDTTVPATAADSGLQLVTAVDGFSGPESVVYDASQDVWFVTNINGSPGAKDGNGFISRMTADGTVDSLQFVAGGRGGVTLHAPKGTAIVGDTLWVTDIDAVRGFSTRSGAPLTTIEFGSRAGFLNDIAAGPDGSLYVTDTGVRFGADGSMTPSGTDQVFRVAPDRSVTTAVRADSLVAPNGITWDRSSSRFVIVSFQSPTLFQWAPGDSAPAGYASAGGGNDGAELVNGTLLITSWEDSSLTAVSGGSERQLVRGLGGPADIGIDTRRNRVAVPLLPGGRVEIYQLMQR